jgi:NarL family two-component system response regulator LiaR
LYVEERTVKSHVSSILRKLNLKSRTQAALYAVRTGLVSLDDLGEGSW